MWLSKSGVVVTYIKGPSSNRNARSWFGGNFYPKATNYVAVVECHHAHVKLPCSRQGVEPATPSTYISLSLDSLAPPQFPYKIPQLPSFSILEGSREQTAGPSVVPTVGVERLAYPTKGSKTKYMTLGFRVMSTLQPEFFGMYIRFRQPTGLNRGLCIYWL